METALDAVTPEPMRSRAAAVLRDAIVAGRLLPGTRLIEVQLAESLGVSRGTLRQALRELEHEGLVVSTPYRGTYVAEQGPHDLLDAYALRGLLEGFAATQIPPHALPDVLIKQRAELKRMRQALVERRLADIAAIDLDFHAAICAAAGNRRLTQAWEALSDPVRARYANQVGSLYTSAEIIARHEAVITLLATGSPEAIEAGIRTHYLETAQRMAAEMEAAGGNNVEEHSE